MSDPLQTFDPAMDLPGVDELARLHREKFFRLAMSVGLEGQAQLGGNPQALVAELIRLARVGAIAEQQAHLNPLRRISAVVQEAHRRWREELGVR